MYGDFIIILIFVKGKIVHCQAKAKHATDLFRRGVSCSYADFAKRKLSAKHLTASNRTVYTTR